MTTKTERCPMTQRDKAILESPSQADYRKVVDRFYGSFVVSGSGCWEWRKGMARGGYGLFSVSSTSVLAHRFSFFLENGRLPHPMPDHLCRNRKCVNADHMEEVDARTNTLRGVGPTALKAQKTHCEFGHVLALEKCSGKRHCKTCRAAYFKKRDAIRTYQVRKAMGQL
jgi:hypothetical protein